MKHLFIINPVAGIKRNAEEIAARIRAAFKSRAEEYEIVMTRHHGDATDIARAACEKEGPLRIYSIGGDGTLHEVLQGCYQKPDAELAPYPNGTGNDFVKAFPEYDFTDLEKLIDGKPRRIDLLKCGDTVSLNIINCGFDAMVAQNVDKFKKTFTGNLAYYIALFYTFTQRLGQKLRVEADGEVIYNDRSLLAAVANGNVYGGGFKAAPDAKVDDGLADLVIVKNMPRLKIATFVDSYKTGEHEKIAQLLLKARARKISVSSDAPFTICYDGECEKVTECTVEVLPAAMSIVLPE